ncbi:MAG: hypothetical protein H0U74_04485 [Bradymonadaceae bacterium]|nr:hypothetical protein [Lujinxingiaceae bacterium]
MTDEQPVEKKPMEGLFAAFPHGTLAALAAGTGAIAVFTMLIELFTQQSMARAMAFEISFISLPLGVATMILAALTARHRMIYALPALLLGIAYWSLYVVFR